MKKKITFWIPFVMILLLVSCSGLGKEHVIGNYYLTKIDYVDEELDLSYRLESGSFIGVVEPTVFAIGNNDEFIIVKQHPREFGKDIDKTVVNYFIVPIKNKSNIRPEDNKLGPFTREEFLIKRKELQIPADLEFSKVFDE